LIWIGEDPISAGYVRSRYFSSLTPADYFAFAYGHFHPAMDATKRFPDPQTIDMNSLDFGAEVAWMSGRQIHLRLRRQDFAAGTAGLAFRHSGLSGIKSVLSTRGVSLPVPTSSAKCCNREFIGNDHSHCSYARDLRLSGVRRTNNAIGFLLILAADRVDDDIKQSARKIVHAKADHAVVDVFVCLQCNHHRTGFSDIVCDVVVPNYYTRGLGSCIR
jgi:hypothetical protein